MKIFLKCHLIDCDIAEIGGKSYLNTLTGKLPLN